MVAQLNLKYFNQDQHTFLAIDMDNFDIVLNATHSKFAAELKAKKFELVDKKNPVFFAGDMTNKSQGVSMDAKTRRLHLLWIDKDSQTKITEVFAAQNKKYFNRNKDNTDYYVIPHNNSSYTVAIKYNKGIEEVFVMKN